LHIPGFRLICGQNRTEWKPNYAFNPIAEQALRPNQTIVPQRVNAALDLMQRVRFGLVGFTDSVKRVSRRTGTQEAILFSEGNGM
jgi:hypothetical protein